MELPVRAGAGSAAALDSVSCKSGHCVAVGAIEGVSTQTPLILAGSPTSWKLVNLAVPANAKAGDASVLSVSCASAGNCASVGTYVDRSNRIHGLLVDETKGSWQAGLEAPLPANAQSKVPANLAAGNGVGVGAIALQSVSCDSPGNCAAVGWYRDRSRHQDGLLLQESHNRWAAVEASLPTNSALNPHVRLDSVSCASAGYCTAVGSYFDRSGHQQNQQALVVQEQAGRWGRGVEARLPPKWATGELDSVSCPSTGDCAAVSRDGLLVEEQRGVWMRGVEAKLPSGARLSGELDSVSCASASNCTAVGRFTDHKGNEEGLLLTQRAGRWERGVAMKLPANGATKDLPDGGIPDSALNVVSCTAPGSCIAVGGYTDLSDRSEGALVIQHAGRWTRAVEASLPKDAASKQDEQAVLLLSVSCSPPATCAVVGAYTAVPNSQQGIQQGLLLGPG